MDPAADPLAALRAIHGPQSPHWWPPAPGWWLLAGVLSLLVIMAIGRLRRRRRASAPWRAAGRELDSLWRQYRDQCDQTAYLRALSVLLRRVVLARFARERAQERVAAIGGDPWLALLDQIAGGREFSDGVGRVLGDGPYAPSVSFDPEALHTLVRRLLKKIPAYSGHG